jgi:hypothetical protein
MIVLLGLEIGLKSMEMDVMQLLVFLVEKIVQLLQHFA